MKNIDKEISKYIAVRYQMYAVAAMKQICASDLDKKQKDEALAKFFESDILRSTLQNDIIAIHGTLMRVFYTLLKYKCYWVCKKLLYMKSKK